MIRWDENGVGYMEGQRLTRNLINAERAYRTAVQKVREFNLKVQTIDSSHFTSISSVDASLFRHGDLISQIQHGERIEAWRHDIGAAYDNINPPPSPSLTTSSRSTLSAEVYDGWSGRWNEAWEAQHKAARSRAWGKEQRRRDRDMFYIRKRRKVGSEQSRENSSTPPGDTGTAMKWQHLSSGSRNDWPEGKRPTYVSDARRVSHSSGVAPPLFRGGG